MNERIRKLRQESLDIVPYISAERAELITQFYQSNVPMQVSTPVCRALAFRYIMENKSICVNDGELIVGERGPAPKATPTYPELCCHDLEDFRIMSTRDRTRYDVNEQVKTVYKDKIIPFWSGKTMREKLFKLMTKPWQKAYDAGVFTEFMEQRAPGHAIMDDKIYKYGMIHFKERIAASRAKLDYLNDQDAYDKDQQLQAMDITCDAIMVFAERYAEKVRALAEDETDATRMAELYEIAEICKRVPAHAPRTFHEALQTYWFIYLGVIS